MKMSQIDFESTKFLGGVVGAKYAKLKAIALMNQEEREIIGLTRALNVLLKQKKFIETLETKEDLTEKDLKDLISKVVEPIIKEIGLSKYKMSEISHLSMKIGSQKKRFKDLNLPTEF